MARNKKGTDGRYRYRVYLSKNADCKPPLSYFTLTNLRSSAKAAYELAIPEIVLYNPLVKTTAPAGAPPEPREPISEEQ